MLTNSLQRYTLLIYIASKFGKNVKIATDIARHTPPTRRQHAADSSLPRQHTANTPPSTRRRLFAATPTSCRPAADHAHKKKKSRFIYFWMLVFI